MTKLLFAALLSAAVAVPALAAEGGRTPFPFSMPGEVVTAVPQGFDVGQARMPELPQAYAFAPPGEPTNAPTSREAEVVTAGSLPRNALAGTAQYAQGQSVAQWFASRPGLRPVAAVRSGRSGS